MLTNDIIFFEQLGPGVLQFFQHLSHDEASRVIMKGSVQLVLYTHKLNSASRNIRTRNLVNWSEER